VLGAEPFAPTPIRSPAGHARSFGETERHLERLLDLVPITREYDATPLDRLGLPVWFAVTPLAADLTVHAGKGTCSQAARISAIMEAVERTSAESVEASRVRTASYLELGGRALDPELFDLPFDTAYAPDRTCSWIRGADLLTGRDAWVALDLVLSPAREGICVGPETNGLAAGNEPLEAVLHAVYEVIERDAAARDRFLRRYGEGSQIPLLRIVSPEGLPPIARAWAEELSAAGVQLTLQNITHDVDVPVFRALLTDPGFPGREGQATRFEGLGCDLDPERALTRAVCEAVQAHTGLLVGARDAFEGDAGAPVGRATFLERLLAPSVVERFESGGPLPDDLAGRLALVLERLRTTGFRHCVVVDLSRADVGIPVVRALLAGAAGPFGDTPRRPGLRLLRGLL